MAPPVYHRRGEKSRLPETPVFFFSICDLWVLHGKRAFDGRLFRPWMGKGSLRLFSARLRPRSARKPWKRAGLRTSPSVRGPVKLHTVARRPGTLKEFLHHRNRLWKACFPETSAFRAVSFGEAGSREAARRVEKRDRVFATGFLEADVRSAAAAHGADLWHGACTLRLAGIPFAFAFVKPILPPSCLFSGPPPLFAPRPRERSRTQEAPRPSRG